MRSFSVQIIAVVGMILALVKAMRESFHTGFLTTAIIVSVAACALPAQSQARWQTPPTGAEIPERALEEGISGEATVSCTGTAEGVVDTCSIENEHPEGYGFGQAAAQLVQSGALEPSADGQPIGSFRIRVPFNVEDVAPTLMSNPSWRIPPRPTVNDFPQRALNAGVSGGAALHCTASAEGVPENCEVLQERPTGVGFGEAAIKIVRRGRLEIDGNWQPGASFIVRIPFGLY